MPSARGKAIFGVFWILLAVGIVSAGIACLNNPCLHGICIDDINSTYSCYCVDGYTGVQCQTNWDECWSAPCLNGGTCIDGIASYNCSCPDGFIGDNCETNFNECESNPCMNNGTCIDMTNGYVCSCVPGFSGEHCEMDIAVCNATEEVRCHNGGQCIEGPGFKFYCRCAPGWTGHRCEDQIDECESNPCQNGGICIDMHSDYMCACTYGFTGKSCEVAIEFCNNDTCSNNAICVVEDGTRVCYCVPDYHGERCELQYDECLLGPGCMNGGTCIDGVDNFTCSCPPRLTGLLCECLILDDGSQDCEYVSPTPLPDISSTSLFTTSFEGLTTREIITTDLSEFNVTRKSTTKELETDLESTSVSVPSTSTEEVTEETSTDEITTPELDISTSTIVPTTKTESLPTTDLTTIVTLESGDSKTETTAACQGSCETTTEVLFTMSPTATDTTTDLSDLTTYSSTVETVKKPTIHIIDTGTTTEEATTSQEITTTPQVDTTTEKLFTDNPTEHGVTESFMSTTTSSTTPDTVDTTTSETAVENTTNVLTTGQTECTESFCNNHGTCVNTPYGIRCQCKFNYKGRYCEEKIAITSAAFGEKSYVTHTFRNTSSIAIAFNAKTLITDGQIMEVDIGTGVYMQLYMNAGLLKFKFSCGYQTMLLSELKTFVNKGYLMKIETRLDVYLKEQHCNATLRLNDTVAMSGGQVANVTSLDYNTTIYLGNFPNGKHNESKPFIGCISDLFVNGEKLEVVGDAIDGAAVSECSSLSCLSGPCHNGGTCSDHGNGYICSCPNEWVGSHCNQSVCDHNPCKSGGSCVKHPGSGFLCLCPYGKHGIFCEYNVEITRPSLAPISTGISSYLIYPLSPSAINSDRFDLRLRFQTPDMEQIALLAFIGQSGRHDSRSQHLALTFVKGYIMLTWNMGSGPRRIFTSRALSPRRGGHTVRVWRRGRSGGLSVDSRHNVSGNAPTSDAKMTLIPYIYIGGHPSENFHELPHDLPLHSGWRGCIWEVGGQAVGSGKAVGGRGVGQCGVAQCTSKSCNAPRGVCIHSPATYGCICNEGWFGPTCAAKQNPCDPSVTKCRGRCLITADKAQCDCPYGKTGVNCDEDLIPTDALFTGVRSFVKLFPQLISSVSLAFEAEIKPTKELGLILFVRTPHFYTSLSLQGGLLEYRWTDHLSGLTSLVRSGVFLTVAQWHKVKAGRYGSRLYVWADGSLTTEAMLAHAYPHTQANATVLLGGAKDLASLPFDAMSGPPESFTGCIRNFHINNVMFPLEKHNIQESRNIGDCDGTACGSETCGGGTCLLDHGRARCACALTDTHNEVGGAGGYETGAGRSNESNSARCRRHLSCSGAVCGPGGRCRRGLCVCAAGRAGDRCQLQINVTIPQFSGNSLLSLGHKHSPTRHTGAQRLQPTGNRPAYISMNFTTAEPNGLLLWANMDIDYIGMGLVNGILKISWYFYHDNSTIVESHIKQYRPITSRFTSKLIPNAGFLADAEWHVITLRVERSNFSVTVDESLVYVDEQRFGIGDYADVDVFIGGINEDDSAIAKKTFPNNFKGCIDHISTKEDSYITNYVDDVYSENVKSCQLFP